MGACRLSAPRKPAARSEGRRIPIGAEANTSLGERPAARRSHAVAIVRTLAESNPAMLVASSVTSFMPAEARRTGLPVHVLKSPPSTSWQETSVAHSLAARAEKVTRSWSGISTTTSLGSTCASQEAMLEHRRRGGGDSQAISSYMSEAPDSSLQTEPERRRSESRR
eukprot:scaffold272625_cov26-Tisochrysis_lutea.AAC.4